MKQKSLNRLSVELALEEIMHLSQKDYATFTDKYNLNKNSIRKQNMYRCTLRKEKLG